MKYMGTEDKFGCEGDSTCEEIVNIALATAKREAVALLPERVPVLVWYTALTQRIRGAVRMDLAKAGIDQIIITEMPEIIMATIVAQAMEEAGYPKAEIAGLIMDDMVGSLFSGTSIPGLIL